MTQLIEDDRILRMTQEKSIYEAQKKVLRDELTRRRQEIKVLFGQIATGTGARKEKVNRNLEGKIIEFRNLATQIEEMSEIYSQHHNSALTGQAWSTQSYSGQGFPSSNRKIDASYSASKTTADGSRNPTNSIPTSGKKTSQFNEYGEIVERKRRRNGSKRKVSRQHQGPGIMSLVEQDGEIYMVLTNGDYIGPLKLTEAQLAACANDMGKLEELYAAYTQMRPQDGGMGQRKGKSRA